MTIEEMKSYPGYSLLRAMMARKFTPLTIETVVNLNIVHKNPRTAMEQLLEKVEEPGMTEQVFWRYLQSKVLQEENLKEVFRTKA